MELNKGLFISFVLLTSLYASAAETVSADAATVCRPIKNSPESIAAGDSLIYDDPALPSGAFYGLFEIRCKLDRNQYYGSNAKIHIYVQKSGDSWKKIAEVPIPEKTDSGDWIVKYIWNSREASFEWQDSSPFRTELKLKFTLIDN